MQTDLLNIKTTMTNTLTDQTPEITTPQVSLEELVSAGVKKAAELATVEHDANEEVVLTLLDKGSRKPDGWDDQMRLRIAQGFTGPVFVLDKGVRSDDTGNYSYTKPVQLMIVRRAENDELALMLNDTDGNENEVSNKVDLEYEQKWLTEFLVTRKDEVHEWVIPTTENSSEAKPQTKFAQGLTKIKGLLPRHPDSK